MCGTRDQQNDFEKIDSARIGAREVGRRSRRRHARFIGGRRGVELTEMREPKKRSPTSARLLLESHRRPIRRKVALERASPGLASSCHLQRRESGLPARPNSVPYNDFKFIL